MSDRFAAQIWIGGKVSNTERLYPDDEGDKTTILAGLIAALNEDGASHDFGDTTIDPNCTDWDQLAKYLDENFLLNLKCDQICNGEFAETEQFCIDNDISFDRWSDHYCEYDAENVYFRPGMSIPVMTYANSCEREVVDGKCVRKGMDLVNEFNANYNASDKASDWAKLEEGLRYLRDACPELPPKLEKFELI